MSIQASVPVGLDPNLYQLLTIILFKAYDGTNGVTVQNLTSANRGALSNPKIGLIVFDTDMRQFMGYNGTNWVVLG